MGTERQDIPGIPAEQSKVLTVRMSQVDADLIDRIAQREDIKRSDVMRWAIAEWLIRHV